MDTPLLESNKLDTANTPLQKQLDEVTKGLHALPDDLVRQLEDATKNLIASGIAAQVLKKGDRAPHFTLPDAQGHAVILSQLLMQGPVVLTFYRGAWCPYCNLQLAAYQQKLSDIRELGASLVAVSPQTPDHSLSLAEKQALSFPVLSDVGNHAARAFGLVFTVDERTRPAYQRMGVTLPEYNGDASWELPIPGTFVLDQTGSVRLAFADPNFTRRLDPSFILKALSALRREVVW